MSVVEEILAGRAVIAEATAMLDAELGLRDRSGGSLELAVLDADEVGVVIEERMGELRPTE